MLSWGRGRPQSLEAGRKASRPAVASASASVCWPRPQLRPWGLRPNYVFTQIWNSKILFFDTLELVFHFKKPKRSIYLFKTKFQMVKKILKVWNFFELRPASASASMPKFCPASTFLKNDNTAHYPTRQLFHPDLLPISRCYSLLFRQVFFGFLEPWLFIQIADICVGSSPIQVKPFIGIYLCI